MENNQNKSEICLLNDSFPPLIDGVANAVSNYARVLSGSKYGVSVVTPENPEADDSALPYPVIRYPGLDLRRQLGYTAGNPFSPKVQRELAQRDICLLHSHCPIMSNIIAREIRTTLDVPFVMTYHTKFDIDIANVVKLEPLQEGAIRALVENASACDELWTVSDGAGRSLQKLGYTGDYLVMPNGVDIPRGKATREEVIRACADVDLPAGVPVFLFVGRMMWYKGIRLILEALAALKSQRLDFRMVFIGGGGNREEIETFSRSLGLEGRCLFLGPIHDRSVIRAWYTRADLMLFPSTFDTNGLVVREAAACGLGTVLIRESCAAEGVEDRQDGLLVEENAASLAVCLSMVMHRPEFMHRLGENACRQLYLSWDDAVKIAMDRYEVVMEKYKAGEYHRRRDLADGLFDLHGELLEHLRKVEQHVEQTLEQAAEHNPFREEFPWR